MSVDSDGNKYVSYSTYVENYDITALYIPFVCTPRYFPFYYTSPNGIIETVLQMALNNRLNYWYDENPYRTLDVRYYSTTNTNINTMIEKQLNDNFPVILVVYKNENYVMYPYDDSKFCGKGIGLEYYKRFSHYMTITGIMHDSQSDDTYYIVSSWGKKYIIDYDVLSENPGLDEWMCTGVYLNH